MKKYSNPTPWVAQATCARGKRFVQVNDAEAKPVLPWEAFEATGLSHQRQKKLAERIVDGVNKAEGQVKG